MTKTLGLSEGEMKARTAALERSRELENVRAKIWKKISNDDRVRVKNCSEESDRRISAANEDISEDYDEDLSELA